MPPGNSSAMAKNRANHASRFQEAQTHFPPSVKHEVAIRNEQPLHILVSQAIAGSLTGQQPP